MCLIITCVAHGLSAGHFHSKLDLLSYAHTGF